MKLPRDVSGADLAKALARIGYRITRQTGSHIRLTIESPTQQHITIPAHDPLKPICVLTLGSRPPAYAGAGCAGMTKSRFLVAEFNCGSSE